MGPSGSGRSSLRCRITDRALSCVAQGRRRRLRHPRLMPEGYQTSIGTRCATSGLPRISGHPVRVYDDPMRCSWVREIRRGSKGPSLPNSNEMPSPWSRKGRRLRKSPVRWALLAACCNALLGSQPINLAAARRELEGIGWHRKQCTAERLCRRARRYPLNRSRTRLQGGRPAQQR